MRNRNGESDANQWWESLPSRVRTRISAPPPPAFAPQPEPPPQPFSIGELLRDLATLALLFGIITLANILFLLVALSFVFGRN
jgi:hypothetical protein